MMCVIMALKFEVKKLTRRSPFCGKTSKKLFLPVKCSHAHNMLSLELVE